MCLTQSVYASQETNFGYLDATVKETQRNHIIAGTTVEVQRELAEANIPRMEDPLQFGRGNIRFMPTCTNLLWSSYASSVLV